MPEKDFLDKGSWYISCKLDNCMEPIYTGIPVVLTATIY